MIDKLNIIRGKQAIIFSTDFLHRSRITEFRNIVIECFPFRRLPCKQCRSYLTLISFSQKHISVLICFPVSKSSGINEQYFIFTVSENDFFVIPLYPLTLFVITNDPQSDGNIRCIEHFPRQYDDSLNLMVFDKLFPDLVFFRICAKSTVSKKEGSGAL